MDSISVQAAFNSLPRLSEIKEPFQLTPDMRNDTFTFMLPHKHFDLEKNEVLWVIKRGMEYQVTVVKDKDLPRDCSPCMWLWVGHWAPYAFTKKELGYDDVPSIPYTGKFSIGCRWLNNGGSEQTDVKNRVQTIKVDRKQATSGAPNATFANCIDRGTSYSDCFDSICYERTHCSICVDDEQI